MQNATIAEALRQVPHFAQLSDEPLGAVEQGDEVWLGLGEAAFVVRLPVEAPEDERSTP